VEAPLRCNGASTARFGGWVGGDADCSFITLALIDLDLKRSIGDIRRKWSAMNSG